MTQAISGNYPSARGHVLGQVVEHHQHGNQRHADPSGRAANSVKDATVATVRWVFGLLLQSVNTMAKMSLDIVGR